MNLNFGIRRKRFTIDGDESRVIEIDTTDTGILGRWDGMAEWLDSVRERVVGMSDVLEGDEASAKAYVAECKKLDAEVRDKLNYLFDADVCTPIVGGGSLLRVHGDEPLFWTVINTLLPLYGEDIKKESEAAIKRIEKHTAKYQADNTQK